MGFFLNFIELGHLIDYYQDGYTVLCEIMVLCPI
jgi:hypothetical protein